MTTFESQLRTPSTVTKLAAGAVVPTQNIFMAVKGRDSTSQLPGPSLVTTPSHAYMQPTISAQIKNTDTITSKRWSTSKKPSTKLWSISNK